jgi:hypothetical protein
MKLLTRSFGLLLLLMVLLSAGPPTAAQETEDAWTEPINLSRSGAANNPQMVVDASGSVHVFWQDSAAGSYVYSRSVGQGWSAPLVVELPFGTRRVLTDLAGTLPTPLFAPRLEVTPNNRLAAFWIDNSGALQSSNVAIDNVTVYDAWSPAQELAQEAVTMATAVDAGGRLHVVYLRTQETAEFPAGIYYRRTTADGADWTDAAQLYHSSYFRSMDPETANVDISATGTGSDARVHVVWDNASQDRVFYARSINGGQGWAEPLVVDQRQADDDLSATGPSGILVNANAQEAHLIWQAGHGSISCAQYHQWSSDGGETWQLPQRMFEDVQNCPTGNQFVPGSSAPLLLWVNLPIQPAAPAQPNLVAWDGSTWSIPQSQSILTGFVSPDNFRSVTYACHQISQLPDGQLLVVGCGQGQDQDIWLTSKPAGQFSEWFPPPSVWEPLVTISTSNTPISTPQLVADSDGRFHALWIQTEDGSGGRPIIYYAFKDAESWSRPIPVLRSPSGDVIFLSATINQDDRLMVAWVGSSGELFFSQADASRAPIPAEWAIAAGVPTNDLLASGVDIYFAQSEYLYIAYSVPINEGRGIYIARSQDDGFSWQEPTPAFDGQAAGWDVVGVPSLVVAAGDRLHLLWGKEDLLADTQGSGPDLFYSHSLEAQSTFSEPELVGTGISNWHSLITTGGQSLYRLWLEPLTSGAASQSARLQLQESSDGGQSWRSPTGLAGVNAAAAVGQDLSGQLHLAQLLDGELQYWLWADGRWAAGDGLEASVLEEASAGAVAVTGDGALAYVASGANASSEVSGSQSAIVATGRQVTLSESRPAVLPTSTPTATATVPPTTTPAPQPTPTVDLATIGDPEPGGSSSANVWLISAVPVALIVFVVLGIGVWRVTRRGRP